MKKLIIVSFIFFFVNFGFSQHFDSPNLKVFFQKITYPDSLIKQNVRGTVYLEYWIEKDGTITNQKIIKSPHAVLSKIVLDASYFIKKIEYDMPEEKYVRLKIILPVHFKSKG